MAGSALNGAGRPYAGLLWKVGSAWTTSSKMMGFYPKASKVMAQCLQKAVIESAMPHTTLEYLVSPYLSISRLRKDYDSTRIRLYGFVLFQNLQKKGIGCTRYCLHCCCPYLAGHQNYTRPAGYQALSGDTVGM